MKSLQNHFNSQKLKHEEFLAKYGPDFEKPSGNSFGLNKAEQGAVEEWAASLRAEIMAIQKTKPLGLVFDDIMASDLYYGATGGGYTYAFIPTSMGTICVVTEAITGKSLNVAEATDWFFHG